MRTIKFKGKSVEDGQWNYGDLSHVAGQTLIKNNPCRDGRPKFTFVVDPRLSVSSRASMIRTARKFMRVTLSISDQITVS